jgi:DNA-directed RNA polymerase subunit RPC12/RpoP
MSETSDFVSKNIKVCLACGKETELPATHRLNVCPHCGAVQSKVVSAVAPNAETAKTPAAELKFEATAAVGSAREGVNSYQDVGCPKCGYEHTQRVEIVHQSGTHTQLGIAAGASPSTLGVGVGASRSQSALSARLAPPKAVDPDLAAAGCLVVTSIIAIVAALVNGTLAFVVAAAGLIWAVHVSRSIAHFNKEKLPSLVAEWRMKFFCSRCGEIFTPRDG